MEREFVPYVLAVKIKELGFNEPCFSFYMGGFEELGRIKYVNPSNVAETNVLAPTLSQCFRFFREKYQIFPEVLTDCTTEPKFVYTYKTFYGNPKDLTEQEWGWENNIGQYSDLYRTYEEAELDCLTKLIELVESKS